MTRKINLLLLLFSLIGGAVGFGIGEVLLQQGSGQSPGIVLIGLYFGILALCVGLACLIAEMIKPRLNGPSWRQRYVGASWKLLVPATLVLLFAAGTLLEFVYELNLNGAKQVKNIVFLIDDSGSMDQNDPDGDRYEATKLLIDKMDQDKEAAIVVFDDSAQLLQPFVRLKNQKVKNEVYARLDALEPMGGGTNFNLALSEALKQIQERSTSRRGTMVILLSDGFSEVDPSEVLREYQSSGVAVNTIGLGLDNPEGSALLKEMAAVTGGQYQDVGEADQLSLAFQKIYDNIGERTLVTERTGAAQNSTYYLILRIAFVMLLGAALGLGLGILFDNRHLAKSFSIGGATGGILAGLLLEFGLSGDEFYDRLVRLAVCLILAAVTALFTFVVPVKDSQPGISQRSSRFGGSRSAGSAVGRRQDEHQNRGF